MSRRDYLQSYASVLTGVLCGHSMFLSRGLVEAVAVALIGMAIVLATHFAINQDSA